jgi:hypothetical protein
LQNLENFAVAVLLLMVDKGRFSKQFALKT